MIAHFFDINSSISVESDVWVVSKKNPNLPITKISQSDFNLIKKGIFKRTGTPLTISNVEYFIPSDLLEKIKIKCKRSNVNITDLRF